MSSFIDIDSIFRDRDDFPNEYQFQYSEKQTESWYSAARNVKAIPTNPNLQPLDFVNSVKINQLTTPYTEELANQPRIYVDFRSTSYKDSRLIFAAFGYHKDAKFVCVQDYIQRDSNGVGIWIRWKSSMKQVMRFDRRFPIIFSLTLRNGNLPANSDDGIEPDPSQQVSCTFELIPFMRDGLYDNQSIQPKSL